MNTHERDGEKNGENYIMRLSRSAKAILLITLLAALSGAAWFSSQLQESSNDAKLAMLGAGNRTNLKDNSTANGALTYMNGTFNDGEFIGNQTVITYTVNGSFVPPAGVDFVDVLLVAGGGGGGQDGGRGGGGGGGGVIYNASYPMTPGQNYTVTVGDAGSAGDTTHDSTPGTPSIFSTMKAIGGGRGGGRHGTDGQGTGVVGGAGNITGSYGGSGGGGAALNGGTSYAGGAGTTGQGNAGGASPTTGYDAGAGGGASAAGQNGISESAGGAGGAGTSNSITGASVVYGGGGGGGSTHVSGAGGIGGGGRGTGTNGSAVAGTNGLGGGGGGGSASGGSGIVIIRYNRVAGQFGKAVTFNGVDDYVNIPDNSNLDVVNAITIAMWINFRGMNSSDGTLLLTKHSSSADTGYLLAQYQDKLIMQFGDGGGGWPYSGNLQSNTPMKNNTWYHIAATRSGTQVNFYLNGVLDGSPTVGGNDIAVNTQNMWLGRDVNSPLSGTSFNGTIDEVQVWSRALTGQEINDSMRSRRPIAGNSLISSWSFEEDSGTRVYDENNIRWGPYGEALNFDGVDDTIYVGDIDLSENFTISAWVKLYGIASEDIQTIISKRDQSDLTTPYMLLISARASAGGSSATPVVRLILGSGTGNPIVTSAAVAMPSNWIYVTGVVSGTTMQLYINGVVSGSSETFSGTRQNNDIVTKIGGPYLSGGLPVFLFNGTIDQLMVFNNTLSAAQVKELYSCQIPEYPAAQWNVTGVCNLQGVNASNPSAIMHVQGGNITLWHSNLTIDRLEVGAGGKVYVQNGRSTLAISNG